MYYTRLLGEGEKIPSIAGNPAKIIGMNNANKNGLEGEIIALPFSMPTFENVA